MITGFQRDTWAEINLEAIASNVRAVYKRCMEHNIRLMAVVKAGGYGHGAIEVAKVALASGASYLVVSMIDEAIELREAGIDAPILVLGWTKPELVPLAVKYDLTLTVLQIDWLIEARSYVQENDRVRIHLKLDTGMGRFGVREKDEIEAIAEFFRQDSRFFLEGVFTHYATADDLDTTYVNRQHERFLNMLSWLEKAGIHVPVIHNGNSAFGLRFPKKVFHYFRLGIAMYGLTPSPAITNELHVSLKPAFSLKSKIVQVKKLEANEAVGYGANYVTKREEWIGTMQIGYADGWLRAHSLKGGEVLVNGKRAPFVGPICMNQCMIRLPGPVQLGTVATLIGKDGEDEITIDEVAERLDTINYEIPCMIGQRVPRVYVATDKA